MVFSFRGEVSTHLNMEKQSEPPNTPMNADKTKLQANLQGNIYKAL